MVATRLAYGATLRGPLAYSLGVEGTLAQRSGYLAAAGSYRAWALRIGVEGMVGARLPNTGVDLFAGVQARNHRRFGDFELRRRDNLRFDLRLAASYPITPTWHATAVVGRGLRDRDDSHFVDDPRHQAFLGAIWLINKRSTL